MPDEIEELTIDGCPVRITFTGAEGRWTARGLVRCGIGENEGERQVTAGPCATKESAEQEILAQIHQALGHNVDRNTSRVRNWS
jgi:hypothetical protein